jgi:hypothetical protein
MQKYQDVVLKPDGSVIQGASILVQSFPGAVTSTIYSDDGVTTQANPMTTDSLGRFAFYAADGDYQLVVSGASIATQTITDIQLQEKTSVGTWTPDLTFSGIVAPNFVKDASTFGIYTRVGNRVFCDLYLRYNTFTYSGTGDWEITGLPFTAANSCIGTYCSTQLGVTAQVVTIFCGVNAGSTSLYLYKQTASAGGVIRIVAGEYASGANPILQASFSYVAV